MLLCLIGRKGRLKMANPQREDGHVDIANEIVEALARTQLSGHEGRVLWALWRKTWGWVKKDKKGKTIRNKKGQALKLESAVMSSKCWEKLTGLNKYIVSRTLRELYLRQIVIKFDNKNRWGFQKDYDKWLQPIKKIVTKNGNTYFVTRNGNTFSKIDNGISKIDNGISKFDNKMSGKPKGDKSLLTSKETLKETLKEKGIIFKKAWKDFKAMRTKIRKPMTERAEELLIKKLDGLSNNEEEQIAILNQSIMNSWLGVFPLKGDYDGRSNQNIKQSKTPEEDKYKHLEENYEV